MNRTLVIAEAGVNHNGNLETAFKMIEVARNCGADIIKFQTAKPELVISKYAEKASYQKVNTGDSDESQLEMCKKLHFKFEDYYRIVDKCKKEKIRFLSTPFDLDSIEFLHELGMSIWKIPSGEITNLPYLLRIAELHEEIILSTGMSTLDEVKTAIKILQDNGAGKISVLHCTTEYPAPIEDVNLRAMNTMANELQLPVGYSDHTSGIEVSIAAVAIGACIVEKHFTLDKNMPGPDHRASLEPHELKTLIDAIRTIELAMGNGIKAPSPSEIKNIAIARKSVVAKVGIKKGEFFSEKNLTTKRPGDGISPMEWFNLLGKTAIRDFEEDELICL